MKNAGTSSLYASGNWYGTSAAVVFAKNCKNPKYTQKINANFFCKFGGLLEFLDIASVSVDRFLT